MNTLYDVKVWAEANGESYDAICEITKVPARLGLHDDDLASVPACLWHFESVVAESGYATVSKSKNLKDARRRGNSRIRNLLKRYHGVASATANGTDRAAWDAVIAHIEGQEGFVDSGARFTKGASKALWILRARAGCAPSVLDQSRVDILNRSVTAEKRKTLRKAVRFINRLVAERATLPEIAHLLPRAPLAPPGPVDRSPKIDWSVLPASFLDSMEALMSATISTPEMQAELAEARIDAGDDRDMVIAEFEARRGRKVGNSSTALEGYRAAIAWLVKSALADGVPAGTLADVRDVLEKRRIRAALDAGAAAARASATLKDPEKRQTLHNRIANLRALANHGLLDRALVQDIDLLRAAKKAVLKEPGGDGMTEEIDAFCKLIQRNPNVAASIVNAPALIARKAEEELARVIAARTPEESRRLEREITALATWRRERASKPAGQREGPEPVLSAEGLRILGRQRPALRLYAGAALWVIQMSRPVRPSNLIRSRVRDAPEAKRNLGWIGETDAEIGYPKGEIKNDVAVTVPVTRDDATILRRWVCELRPRYALIDGVEDSVYLIPGRATPRHVKDFVRLPSGCVAVSTLAEIWAAATDIIGVGMTPHMCRHAVATLVLAVEPGNFAKAAAILGDTEATVRKHYGRDSGKAAAATMRQVLLEAHPQMFKQLRGALK